MLCPIPQICPPPPPNFLYIALHVTTNQIHMHSLRSIYVYWSGPFNGCGITCPFSSLITTCRVSQRNSFTSNLSRYVCKYVCIYVCMYVCMYICISIFFSTTFPINLYICRLTDSDDPVRTQHRNTGTIQTPSAELKKRKKDLTKDLKTHLLSLHSIPYSPVL